MSKKPKEQKGRGEGDSGKGSRQTGRKLQGEIKIRLEKKKSGNV